MHNNVKRGLLRLYIVLWTFWALAILGEALKLPAILLDQMLVTLLAKALLWPAVLLVGLLCLGGILPCTAAGAMRHC